MKFIKLLTTTALISTLMSSTYALANTEFKDCSNLFYKPLNVKEDSNTEELCNNDYAVLYSFTSRTPLFSYEKTDGSTTTVKRVSSFKEDTRIPEQYRSELKDYRNSGYDKGHLTPSGDMSNLPDQQSTFLLSNVAPQASKFNQQPWRLLEANVKNYPYKVTGVVFNSPTLNKIGNVLVPTQFYKIVSDGTCTNSYIGDNKPDSQVNQIDNQKLLSIIGYDFNFPTKQCD